MMGDKISRRTLLKSVVAGTGSLLPAADRAASVGGSFSAPGNPAKLDHILPLSSSSGVYIPPRGKSFTKFSFDFPEPSVEFAGLQFSFRVYTFENTYALDRERMTVEDNADGLAVTCSGFVWAGGQEKAPGRLRARFRKNGTFIEWDARVEMEQPVKSAAAIVRGVPRGKISAGGPPFFDPKDDELLFGYPFGGGALFPVFSKLADATLAQIDGDPLYLNWVDWDNDRHMEGWMPYMNVGVDPWREWLASRIDEVLNRHPADAYFLDIAGGWENNAKADTHEGTQRLVADLARRHPGVVCCGEMHYDALMSFIPLYHALSELAYPAAVTKYARFFQHLSHPAPGRGSSGVHESGFSKFDPETLSLNDLAISTLTVVDHTFDRYQDVMTQIIGRAKHRAGIACGVEGSRTWEDPVQEGKRSHEWGLPELARCS